MPSRVPFFQEQAVGSGSSCSLHQRVAQDGQVLLERCFTPEDNQILHPEEYVASHFFLPIQSKRAEHLYIHLFPREATGISNDIPLAYLAAAGENNENFFD